MVLTNKPVCLITGCGSGLGLALAQTLEKAQEFRIIVTARKKSIPLLKEYFNENENVRIRELDVTSEDQRNAVVSESYRDWNGVDVLVNNAGISYRSVIEHMDDESELYQLNTNYLGPMALIRQVIPGMREKGCGKIINVSSVSGMMAMPTMASYSASKHALEGATEALWYEMKPFGIKVSLVQPGFIHSSSFQKVYYSKKAKLSEALEGPYADYYANISPFIEKIMNYSTTTPEKISKKMLKIIKEWNPPLWVPVTPDAFLFFFLRKILPRRLFHEIMYRFLPNSNIWGKRYTKLGKLNSSLLWKLEN